MLLLLSSNMIGERRGDCEETRGGGCGVTRTVWQPKDHHRSIERPDLALCTDTTRHDSTDDGQWTTVARETSTFTKCARDPTTDTHLLTYNFCSSSLSCWFFFLSFSFAHIFKLFVISSDLPACLSCLSAVTTNQPN